MTTNSYSTTWFDLFLRPIASSQTAHEIAFLTRQLPRPNYTAVLDLCCGTGRHARALAAEGYHVTGVDLSAAALDEARSPPGEDVTYIQADMRQLDNLPGAFDAIISLWQSFGYFDQATNLAILRQIHAKLRPGGRCILDMYHRSFFVANQGRRDFTKEGLAVTETKQMDGNRLTVRLAYGDGRPEDVFDWQLWSPEELCADAIAIGLHPLLVCADFDETTPVSPGTPRMQLVLEKACSNSPGYTLNC